MRLRRLRRRRRQVRHPAGVPGGQDRLREAHLLPPLPDPRRALRGGRRRRRGAQLRADPALPPGRPARPPPRHPARRLPRAPAHAPLRGRLVPPLPLRPLRPPRRLRPLAHHLNRNACHADTAPGAALRPPPPSPMLNLQQKQSLQQKLSPQQIQYSKLRQLPTPALGQRIKAELEANPLLEEGDELETEERATEEEVRENADETTEEAEQQESAEENEYDWEEYLNNPDDLYGYKARVDQSDEEDRREIPIPAATTMTEHLTDQLSFLDLTEAEYVVAEQIIGSIDEDGYLRRPLESIIDDIVFNHGIMLDEQQVEDVLKRIQRLDPVGIASRSLQECLLVQLEVMPEDTPGRDVAIQIIRDAYKAFTMKHFDAIMKRLNIDGEALKEAFDLILRLNPKPGEGDFVAQQNYITPDFMVRYDEGEFIITLNGRNEPQLRISRHYRQMLQQLSDDQKRDTPSRNGVDAETKLFLKNKMESARWFINSINQRRHTMMKVMETIV